MATPIPFWTGKDVKLILLLEDKKLELPNMSVEVTQLGEDVQDDMNGEDRSRFDTIVDGYAIAIQGKQERCDQVKAFLQAQANRDNRQLPKESSVGFLIYHRDTTRSAFDAREITLGLWAFSWGGRKERNATNVPFKARYFDSVNV
jgi:hypothetical protein